MQETKQKQEQEEKTFYTLNFICSDYCTVKYNDIVKKLNEILTGLNLLGKTEQIELRIDTICEMVAKNLKIYYYGKETINGKDNLIFSEHSGLTPLIARMLQEEKNGNGKPVKIENRRRS